MTIQNTPVLRTMKQDNNTSWLIIYEELQYVMAIVRLSHNNHLYEVLDRNLRSKNLLAYGHWWSLWITGQFKLWKGFHVMQFIQAQFVPMKE